MFTILISKTIDHHDHFDYQDHHDNHDQTQNDQLNQDRPEWEWWGSSCSCSPPCLRSGCSVHSMWARNPAPGVELIRSSRSTAGVDSLSDVDLHFSQTDEQDIDADSRKICLRRSKTHQQHLTSAPDRKAGLAVSNSTFIEFRAWKRLERCLYIWIICVWWCTNFVLILMWCSPQRRVECTGARGRCCWWRDTGTWTHGTSRCCSEEKFCESGYFSRCHQGLNICIKMHIYAI